MGRNRVLALHNFISGIGKPETLGCVSFTKNPKQNFLALAQPHSKAEPIRAHQPAQLPKVSLGNNLGTEPLRVVRPERKLMSYNAHDFFQMQTKTKKGHSGKPLSAMQALAEVIRQEDPDVIAFQEVGDKGLLNQFNTQHLKGLYPNIVSQYIPESGQHQLGMISKGNLKVVSVKSHWSEVKQHNKRDVLEATFETETGYRFTVLNLHYKSMRGGESKTAPVRLHEAKNTARILKQQLALDPDAPILVTGDLNTLHGSPLGKPVIDTILTLDNPDGDNLFTEISLKNQQADPTNTSHGHFPDAKLDYTFVSKALLPQVKKAYVAGKFDQEPWSKASDHLPFITVFEEGKPPVRLQKEEPVIEPSTPPKHHESKRALKKRKFDLIA